MVRFRRKRIVARKGVRKGGTYRKRRYIPKRRFIRRPKNTLVNKAGGPFPTKLYTKLKFAQTNTIASGAGTSGVQTFRLNSLYDPDYSGGGLQPRYYDTLCGATNGNAPYACYRVHGAKIKVTFLSNTASTVAAYGALRIYSDNVGGLSTASALGPQDLGEVPWTKYTVVQSYNGANSLRTLKFYVPMNKIFGIKDVADADDMLAYYNASPSRVAYADIYVSATDGATNVSLVCTARITYYCELFVPNKPTYS